MAGLCADCTACCTVFEVKEVDKPFGQPCKHLGPTAFGTGCTVYSERPVACNHYICLWLDSQRRPELEKMPEELRPNVCKTVMGWPFGLDRETLFVYPLPGHEMAWCSGPVAEHLQMVLSRGGKIVVVTEKTRIALKGDMAVIGTEEEFARILS